MWLTVTRDNITEELVQKENCCYAREVYMEKLPAPEGMGILADRYREALSRAQEEKAETVVFPGFPACGQQSVMFQAATVILKVLTDSRKEDGFPEKAVIVCDNDEAYKLLMVVYNMYYAGTKAARMNDGRWD